MDLEVCEARSDNAVQEAAALAANIVAAKDEGNTLFTIGEMSQSMKKYNEALGLLGITGDDPAPELGPEKIKLAAVLQVNLAAIFNRLEEWENTIKYASRALVTDPADLAGVKWKALYRRGIALKYLKRPCQALAAMSAVLQLKPDYRAAQKQLTRLQSVLASRSNAQPPQPPGVGGEAGATKEKKKKVVLKTIIGIDRKVAINEFKVMDDLGEGNFCRVMQAEHKKTKEMFALKVIEKKKVNRMRIRHKNIDNEIKMEKEVLAKLRHPGIVRLYQTFMDASNLYFLLEYCPGGELWLQLQKDDEMVGCRASLAAFYAAQIVSTLEYMRAEGVVHRDLKPENIMLTSTGHLKVVDFGTAKNLKDTTLNGPDFVGTPEYMSPELLKNKTSSDCNSDLWALGCIIYQLHVGPPPFKALSPFLTMQKAMHIQLFFPEGFPPIAKDLVQRLIVWEPTARLGAACFEDLKQHPYFKATRWESLFTDPPPLPTLEEMCLEQQILRHPWRYKGYTRLKPQLRAHIMHVLERKKCLLPTIRRFFPSAAAANCCRARLRHYLGLQRRGEDEFIQNFKFVVLSRPEMDCSPERRALVRGAVRRINSLKPLPRVAIIMGPLTKSSPGTGAYEAEVADLQEVISELEPDILPMFVGSRHDFQEPPAGAAASDSTGQTYKSNFGDDYYSTWFGGLKLVVLNGSALLDAHKAHSGPSDFATRSKSRMMEWVKYESYIGNLCAKHMVVVMQEPLEIPVTKVGPLLDVVVRFKKKKAHSIINMAPPAAASCTDAPVEVSIRDYTLLSELQSPNCCEESAAADSDAGLVASNGDIGKNDAAADAAVAVSKMAKLDSNEETPEDVSMLGPTPRIEAEEEEEKKSVEEEDEEDDNEEDENDIEATEGEALQFVTVPSTASPYLCVAYVSERRIKYKNLSYLAHEGDC